MIRIRQAGTFLLFSLAWLLVCAEASAKTVCRNVSAAREMTHLAMVELQDEVNGDEPSPAGRQRMLDLATRHCFKVARYPRADSRESVSGCKLLSGTLNGARVYWSDCPQAAE